MTKQTQGQGREKLYDGFIAKAQSLAIEVRRAHKEGRRNSFDSYVEDTADLRAEYIASYRQLDPTQRTEISRLLCEVKSNISDYLDCFQVRDMRRILQAREKQ
jgi:hypothetical protein